MQYTTKAAEFQIAIELAITGFSFNVKFIFNIKRYSNKSNNFDLENILCSKSLI